MKNPGSITVITFNIIFKGAPNAGSTHRINGNSDPRITEMAG
jgi:hypothetical protein